jgi:L-ascorbate metabolism protein UlaG (beta-lactamase superfamily)
MANYTIPEKYRMGALPGGAPHGALTLQWFGTAAFRLTFKDTVLLIDPYVTRAGLFRIMFLRLFVNEALCRELFPRADHIIVGHSHCDHVLDVPHIARETGAVVHGSTSTAAVCRGADLPDPQIHEADTWRPYEIGDFRVTFVPSKHSKVVLNRVPYPGHITGAPRPPLKTRDYKHGDTYMLLVEAGGMRILHLGSADFHDEELERVGPVDIFLMGLAGRGSTENFMPRVMAHTRPRYLIPQHFDNFFSPFRKGLKLNHGVALDSFFEEAAQVCPDSQIIMPDILDGAAFDPQTGTRIF